MIKVNISSIVKDLENGQETEMNNQNRYEVFKFLTQELGSLFSVFINHFKSK